MKSADTAASSPISALARLFRQLLSPATKSKSKSKSKWDHWDIGKQSSFSEPLSLDSKGGMGIDRVFNYFDENGDGKISAWELQKRLKTVGGDEEQLELSDEEAEMVVRCSDADGDGLLGLEDFAKMLEQGEEEDKVEELRKAFGMYANSNSDSTKSKSKRKGKGDGGMMMITPKSLKRMLSRLGQSTSMSECKAMIGRFDLNGDGVLDFNEFRAMMRP